MGSDLGGGQFAVSGTNVDLTGTITVKKILGSGTFSRNVVLSFANYSTTANLSGSVLTLPNLVLGSVDIDDEGGKSHHLDLVANISFVGVPEPAELMLLLTAAGAVLAGRQRRRRG